MCGIIGIVSNHQNIVENILDGLKKISYRGYDSAGICIKNESNVIELKKDIGTLEDVIKKLNIGNIKGLIGIGHNRWATHGGVTQANAHPHTDCNNEIFIVHNGIIENYKELKKELTKKGHNFRSQTDSEVIAHFFEEQLKTSSMQQSVEKFFRAARGEFAVLLLRKNDNRIYAFKRGSPLVLGISEGMNILASDIYAFSDKTNRAIFFNENEFAEVYSNDYKFYKFSSRLMPVKKEVQIFEWESQEEGKMHYEHYMLKEIHEEPLVAERLIKSLKYEQKDKMLELKKMIENSRRVVFVAAGTSYHASLLGVYFLNRAGIEAHTIIASEFRNFTLLDENTLVIAITQSGETMDVIEALHGIKQKGVKIASLVNVPYSTVQRMSNISINICAGQEICVAATKTFVNQVIALMHLASLFGYGNDIESVPNEIRNLFNDEEKIKYLAKKLKHKKDLYIIGRGMMYPISREIALKLKEIAYIHAEGMMGGELKHGTIALIEEDVPVMGLVDNDEIISNLKEVEARGADVLVISDCDTEFKGFELKASSDAVFSIAATVIGQLLTYYIAKEKCLPIDRPRNLAKSVTVK